MGVGEVCGMLAPACGCGRVKAVAAARLAEMRVKPANRCFIAICFYPTGKSDFILCKELQQNKA
jgi:hypothetical protein